MKGKKYFQKSRQKGVQNGTPCPNVGEERDYLNHHRCYYDPLLKLFFFASSGVCCNLIPLDQVRNRLNVAFNEADKSGAEVLIAASHEQYTFPYYSNYLPDHMQRIERAAQVMDEYGSKAIFINEGLMGNTAWDK